MFLLSLKHPNLIGKRTGRASREPKIKTVQIEFADAVAESVAIAGTFNDWRPEFTPMVPVGEGRWVRNLRLPIGTYEYCLVLDGNKWVPDPQAREIAPNQFGGFNSVLKVAKSS